MSASSAGPLAPLRAVLDSFWICRVSILSVLAGWLLLYGAPQTQALFFDMHTPDVGLRHWTGFYLAVLLFWMLPTQLSARVMLHAGADRFQEGHSGTYSKILVHLPWVLALTCLVGIALGQLVAFEHIPDAMDRQGRPFEEAAYVQLLNLTAITFALIGLWIFFWVLLPRGIHRLTVRSGLLDIGPLRFIATAMFGRRALGRGQTPDAASQDDDPGDDRFTPEQLQTAWAAITLFAIWCSSWYLVFLAPLDTDPVLTRAPMLPVFLGAWLPLLTFLVYFAHRLRLPLLGGFVLLMAAITNFIPGHEMRILTKGALPESRQASLEEAISIWRQANGCTAKPDPNVPCTVRPIIVAAEGGASRAAFFTASLLAHLDDLTDPAVPGNPPQGVLFSRQLFAISTVSGSSLGAAVFAALREDGWPQPTPERAENALWFRSGKAYGLNRVPIEPLPATRSRKDVVQQILAGDFLSPAIAALSLDIWLPFHTLLNHEGDRTYFLERAWELRYGDPSGSRGPSARSGKSGFERPLSMLAPDENAWRPLLIFNGTSVTTGRRIITSTLYPLFKSPDDERLVEPVFRNSYDTYDLMCRSQAKTPPAKRSCVCNAASDRLELKAPRLSGCDVRLSTAASNSARFPIISSHGDIQGADDVVVDRIVDGAYFDYSGIVSALELRLQVARLDDEIKPFVLFLTNDPGFNAHACALAKGPVRARRTEELDLLRRPAEPPSEVGSGIFGSLRFPLDTLVHAWVARTDQAMSQAVLLNRYENVKAGYQRAPQDFSELRRNYPDDLSFDVISVGARCNNEKQVRPIPMNWWLAMPTQDYLNDEICAGHNVDTLAGVLSQLGPLPKKPPKEDAAATELHKLASIKRYDAERMRVRQHCPGQAISRSRSIQTR